MKNHYDVIILGSGPAGFSCAMQASKFNKKALVIEANAEFLGGTWINTGTVPSKALREAAYTIYRYNNQFGGLEKKKPYERFSMDDLLHFKNMVLSKENEEVRNNLVKNEIEVVHGRGTILDKNTIEVFDTAGNKTTYHTEYIMISTGSTPQPPETFKIDHNKVLDSNSLLKLDHIPRRLVVIGIGINAIEYATMFAAMGTKVTILNENPDILPFLDYEIKEELLSHLADAGIILYHNVSVKGVRDNPLRNCTEIRFSTHDGTELNVIETENVLYFGGRKPNADKIGLENVGVKRDDHGFVVVDKQYRSSVDTIFATGDVIGFPRLASVSFTQGRVAACHMFDIPFHAVPETIPYGIYAIPEIAGIGMTEEDAKKAGIDYEVGRALFKNLTRSAITNAKNGILKLVFEKQEPHRLLGVHIMGDEACDLIHIGQAVLSFGGDIIYFINHVFNYPTFAEAYRVAAFNGYNRVIKAGAKYRKGLSEEDDKQRSKS
jgi:NAD(P) transhydrogenase